MIRVAVNGVSMPVTPPRGRPTFFYRVHNVCLCCVRRRPVQTLLRYNTTRQDSTNDNRPTFSRQQPGNHSCPFIISSGNDYFLSIPPLIFCFLVILLRSHLSLSLCNANCVLVFHVILSYLYFRIIDAIKRDKREKGGGDGGMCVTMLRTLYIYNAPYVQAIKMA